MSVIVYRRPCCRWGAVAEQQVFPHSHRAGGGSCRPRSELFTVSFPRPLLLHGDDMSGELAGSAADNHCTRDWRVNPLDRLRAIVLALGAATSHGNQGRCHRDVAGTSVLDAVDGWSDLYCHPLFPEDVMAGPLASSIHGLVPFPPPGSAEPLCHLGSLVCTCSSCLVWECDAGRNLHSPRILRS